jgi:hypothetical protein
MIHFYHSYNSI